MPAKKRETKARKHLPRKRPTQARGEARVQRILLAAAEVVEEVGYDAATTNMIARRARCSIGSLYQFFPNKASLLHALALQYTDEMRQLLGRVVTEVMGPHTRPMDWREGVGQLVEAFARFHLGRAGFRAVWFGGLLSADLIASAIQCGRDIARGVEPLLEALAPQLPPARRLLIARGATELVGGLLILATERREDDPGWADRVVREAKRACVAYLEQAVADETAW